MMKVTLHFGQTTFVLGGDFNSFLTDIMRSDAALGVKELDFPANFAAKFALHPVENKLKFTRYSLETGQNLDVLLAEDDKLLGLTLWSLDPDDLNYSLSLQHKDKSVPPFPYLRWRESGLFSPHGIVNGSWREDSPFLSDWVQTATIEYPTGSAVPHGVSFTTGLTYVDIHHFTASLPGDASVSRLYRIPSEYVEGFDSLSLLPTDPAFSYRSEYPYLNNAVNFDTLISFAGRFFKLGDPVKPFLSQLKEDGLPCQTHTDSSSHLEEFTEEETGMILTVTYDVADGALESLQLHHPHWQTLTATLGLHPHADGYIGGVTSNLGPFGHCLNADLWEKRRVPALISAQGHKGVEMRSSYDVYPGHSSLKITHYPSNDSWDMEFLVEQGTRFTMYGLDFTASQLCLKGVGQHV